MITVRELIAQLPPDSQKRIEEMTKVLIAEEKLLRESNETSSKVDEAEVAVIEAAGND